MPLAQPIGILGGTFDPVHRGHLGLAAAALAALPIERIVWVPSGDPGHRQAPIVDGTRRVAMLRKAIRGEPRFSIDDAEVRSGKPTFTVPTLERLRVSWGAARPIVVVSGADSFASLITWHRWRDLFDLAHFAVAERPGFALTGTALAPELVNEWNARLAPPAALAQSVAGRITRFAMPPANVSATTIRARLAAGERPTDLLPAAVLAYIETEQLYRS